MPRIRILFTLVFLALLGLGGLTESSESQTSSNPRNSFHRLGSATGIGTVSATVFGLGATASKQRIYAAVTFAAGDHFDVLAIDPDTGDTQVIPSPVAGEYGVHAMTVGPDGNVYLGTAPNAHIMKLDTQTETMVDLGRPVSSEAYIYALTFGSDSRLYGGTYPNCRLVRYDPADGALADLGRVDPVEQYAYSIAAGKDGYIYVGVGPAAANVASYQISTGKIDELLPSSDRRATFPNVYVGTDGNPYATVDSLDFKLNHGTATQITSSQLSQAPSPSKLADGRWVDLKNMLSSAGASVLQMQVLNPTTQETTTTQIPYQGQPVNFMRLGIGPDGNLYGSTLLPADLYRFDTSQDSLSYIGNVGSGTVYSFLSRGSSLLMGAYYGLSTLMAYQPASAFATSGSSPNPQTTSFAGADPSLRPEAMAQGSDAHVYVGAGAKNGALDSPLLEWNPDTSSVSLHDVVPNQSTVSLVPWQNLVIGGTTVNGGAGTQPTASSAVLFGWNTAGHAAQFSITPVAGAKRITDLVLAPNGLTYGFADKTLFEFNPATKQITRTQAVGFNPIYNSASVDESGRIWGLAQEGIFLVDTNSFTQRLFASSPALITAGFARSGNTIYYVSGSSLYSYSVPTAVPTVSVVPSATTIVRTSPLPITVTVKGAAGITPTGTVSMTGTPSSIGTISGTLSSGTVTLTIPGWWLPAGTETLSFSYSGDGNNTPAGATTQVTATQVSAAYSVSLNWNAPTKSPVAVAGYHIYRSASGSAASTLLNSTLDVQTSYADNTVSSGTTYTYEVKSVSANGVESAASNVVTVTIP